MIGLVHSHLDSLLRLPRGPSVRMQLTAPPPTHVFSLPSFVEGWTTSCPPCHYAHYNDSPLSQRHPLALGSGLSVLSALTVGPICLRCEYFPKPSWLAFSNRNLSPRPPHLPGDCPALPTRTSPAVPSAQHSVGSPG